MPAVAIAAAASIPAASQTSTPRDRPPVTFALAGDSIIARKLSVYAEPEFVRLVDLIRGADVAFTNLEMLFHDYESRPMNESGGTWMRAEPALVKELVWAGFDLVSAWDWRENRWLRSRPAFAMIGSFESPETGRHESH